MAPLAGVVLLLPAWPYRLLAFPPWARFGWVSRQGCQVIAEDGRCLAGLSVGLDIAGGEGARDVTSRYPGAARSGPAAGIGAGQQLPLDTRHPGHHERYGDDDQADEDHGLLPSGDTGVAGRRRRLTPGTFFPHTQAKRN